MDWIRFWRRAWAVLWAGWTTETLLGATGQFRALRTEDSYQTVRRRYRH